MVSPYGIFCGMMLDPQNIVIGLNNVMKTKMISI